MTRSIPAHRRVTVRLSVLLGLCLLVPFGTLAYFELGRLSQRLIAQTEDQLDSDAKLLGMVTVDRLYLAEETLRASYASRASGGLSTLDTTGMFGGIGIFGPDTIRPVGSVLPELEEIPAESREFLSETGSLLLATGLQTPTLVLTVDSARSEFLVAEIQPTFLWRASGALPSGTFLRVTEGSEIIPTGSTLPASSGDAEMVTGEWTMFLRPTYDCAWRVEIATPESQVLAPIRTFRIVFGMTACAVLLMTLCASLVLIRRTLRPVALLESATTRLGQGDLTTRATFETGDEFEHLGQAFNRMAEDIESRTEALRAANRVKDRFLANMSHEIRTPLTSILGLAEEELRSPTTGKPRAKAMELVVASGKHALSVVNNILDFSSASTGTCEVRPATTAVQSLIAEVKAVTAPLAEAKSIELEFFTPPGMPEFVEVDAVRLKQALVNLISNGIKFTPEGRVLCTVSHRQSEERGHRLLCSVEDTGIGMNEEQLSRVFEPFEQADTTTTRLYGGTGLGLSLATTIAKAMGGTLTAESTPGEGSTFLLEIDAPIAAAPERPDAAAAPRFEGKLLLAEDVPINRKLIQRVFQKMGLDVIAVENGQEAVDAFKAAQDAGEPFDIVFSDLQMPIMDGHQAVQRLKALSPGTPVIALTAHCLDEERARCRQEGFDGFETKPIDRKSLIAALEQFLAPVDLDQASAA